MTVFVLENSEEWKLKNFWIFLKQSGTQPTDLLVFLIACFILPKSNSSVKTISISAVNNFSPLKTYIFSLRYLSIKNCNKCENRLSTLKYNKYRAVARLQNKRRQVSSAGGASR